MYTESNSFVNTLIHTDKDYDVAIIGGGIGGIMTAYELVENNPSLRICIIEKGHSKMCIRDRHRTPQGRFPAI